MTRNRQIPIEWIDLPPEEFVRKWYRDYYSFCVYGNAAGFGQRFMHRSIEREHKPSHHFNRVLEIGANCGEHLQYVKHSFEEYFLTDIVPQDREVLPRSETRTGLEFKREDACSLSFVDNYFDRVLCSCVLHHVNDVESALIELRRVLKAGGKADLFLSCDPGFLFRVGRYLGPVRETKKLGLDEVKRLLDARDHRNHVAGITRLIRHVFRNDMICEQSYPVRYMSWNWSFWKVFRINKR